MGSVISLVIVRRSDGLVVFERYIGMGTVRDKMNEVVEQEPTMSELGFEIRPTCRKEVRVIASESYLGGADQEEVDKIAKQFPEEKYAWSLIHGY